MKKRISLLLVLCMVLSLLPISAVAVEGGTAAVQAAENTYSNTYVTVSDVTVAGKTLTNANGTFGPDATAVTGENVAISFKVAMLQSYTFTKVQRDSTVVNAEDKGDYRLVSDSVPVPTNATEATQSVTYTILTSGQPTTITVKYTVTVTGGNEGNEGGNTGNEGGNTGNEGGNTGNEGGGGSTGGGGGTAEPTPVEPDEEGTAILPPVQVETSTGTATTVTIDNKPVQVTPVIVNTENMATSIEQNIEAAKAKLQDENTETKSVVIPVLIDAKAANTNTNTVQLPNSVFAHVKEKNNTYKTGSDAAPIEVVVAVTLNNGIVTLGRDAIEAMLGTDEDGDVEMSFEEKTTDIPDTSSAGTFKIAFEVNITVGSKSVNWGAGDDDEPQIILTVEKPSSIEDNSLTSNRIKPYLDGKRARRGTVEKVKDTNDININVPHLTIVSLVEEPASTGGNTSGGGGGGGGSSKPSIKPGEGQTPTTPTTTPSAGVAGFYDVAFGAWYAEYVQYVVDKGLFGGVGNGNFAPDANMTRAMMWTVLARYMGVDTNTGSNWYEAAREWVIAQGISDGTMADGNVTREQFVTMLWRLSGEPAAPTSASFTDGGNVSDYAKTAVNWAVAQGIVNGYSDGSFKPQGSATRAEVAKMLTVFCTNAENAPAETTPTETTPEETTPTEATPEDTSGDVG